MDILGVGAPELLVILLVIILVVGPQDLGKTAKSIGRFLNRMYKSDEWKAITQASRTLRTLPNRLAREAELEELNQLRKDVTETTKELYERSKEIIEADLRESSAAEQSGEAGAKDFSAWSAPPEDSSPGSEAEAPDLDREIDKEGNDTSPEEQP